VSLHSAERLYAQLEAPAAFTISEPSPHDGCDVLGPPAGKAVGHSVKLTEGMARR